MPNHHTVYFLGAGASYTFGYPLTWQIMPEILENLGRNDLFRLHEQQTSLEKKQEKELFSFLTRLYPGLKKIDPVKEAERIPNITEVLSFVDHCFFYDIPPHPDLSDGRLAIFRQLLNRAIAELLMAYEDLPYSREERRLVEAFIAPLRREKKTSEVTIITTNYDLVIDREFSKAIERNRVNFGIAYRSIEDSTIIQPPAKPLFNYYKLHGSLNWVACSICGQYYINPSGSVTHLAFRNRTDVNNTCICSDKVRLKSVLVAPSLVRDIRDANLLQIWKGAMEAIRTADKLVFIGYSLPPEDLAIKSIIMRGLYTRSKTTPVQVKVIQSSDTALPRYENLFGKKIDYSKDGFAKYLSGKP